MTNPSTNIKQFELDLTQFVQKLLPEQVVIFHKKIHMQVLSAIVLKNPVDTGFARHNWQSGTEPNEEKLGEYGEEFARPDVPLNLDGLKAYAVSYLWNNTHYITYLEDGYSDQAPVGFVELSLEQAKAMFGGE